MTLIIPEPVLFNAWKHHLGFIAGQISTYRSYDQLAGLKQNLLNVGNSTTDLYTGSITPADAAHIAIGMVEAKGKLDPVDYPAWIRASTRHYRTVNYPDSSNWVFRIGVDPGRFIHIHPGRVGSHTQRVKASILKTVIGTMVLSQIFHVPPASLTLMNEARHILLNKSPLKSLRKDGEMDKLIRLFIRKLEAL
jgi:hypothetical protein